jgi:hypothetical protein
MTTELKPCLSCGNTPRWCGENNPDPEDDHVCHQIHCDSCGVQFDVDSFDANNAVDIIETRAVIAKAWNTRASDHQNEALMAQVEELREFIEGIGEYALRQESYKEVSLIRKFLSKTPQQSLDSLKARIRAEVVSEITHEVQVMETVDVNPDEYERGYAECQDHVLNILEPWQIQEKRNEMAGNNATKRHENTKDMQGYVYH